MINMIGIYRWKNLGRWDYFTIPHLPVAPGLSHVPLLELLLSRNEYVDRKKCAFQDLQPISIHFDGSISKRVVAEGREYTLPLLWARSGDIALSKIDLKNGAVAVVPDDWESVVVTTHFKVYRPDMERLNPNYFRLLIQTAPFKNWLWANRSGADGRTEVKLDIFESLEIPLPTISEQDELLAAYSSALAEATAMEAEAERIETEARCAFETALGVALPPPMPDRPIFIARFKDFERWSHEGMLQGMIGQPHVATSYPLVTLGEVVDDLENGWSPKCLERPAEGEEWGVLKVGAVSFGIFDVGQNKALPLHLKSRSLDIIRNIRNRIKINI